jgi:hypothetical protein
MSSKIALSATNPPGNAVCVDFHSALNRFAGFINQRTSENSQFTPSKPRLIAPKRSPS